jgi:hypothetical protein
MRVILVLATLHGLVPGLGELVESAVHYASAGHLPHSAGETDLGDRGAEHSCGVTLHSCGCCAGQPVLREHELAVVERGAPELARFQGAAGAIADRGPERPFRPPIA